MIPNVCLLCVSLGEIVVGFFGKSFVVGMISHGGLLRDSLGEFTVRFLKKSHNDGYVFSRGTFVSLAR